VSDAQRPESQADEPAAVAPADPTPHAETDVDGNPVPSDEVLAQQALPAVYTRSPRLIRVVVTAAFVLALVGAIVGFVLPSAFLSGRFAAAGVLALAGALAGALVAGSVVAANERVEARHVARRREAAIQEWLATHPDAVLGDASDAGASADAEPSRRTAADASARRRRSKPREGKPGT